MATSALVPGAAGDAWEWRSPVWLVLVATLLACDADNPQPVGGAPAPVDSPAAGPTTSPDVSVSVEPDLGLLTPDGWGPVRIGMTRGEVVAAAGEDANPDAVGGPEPERCDEFRPSRAPEGLLVMVEDDVVTRISMSRNPDVATAEGIRVGDAGARVFEAYGARASVEPHRYWPAPGKYVTVWRDASQSDERRGVRYEVDADDQVVHIHAGGASIEYVEGCL